MEQIAFADIIIFNKVDLVDQASKERVLARIKVRDRTDAAENQWQMKARELLDH